jgi:1-deoxyxylulose-5-phosphate synthase
MTIDRFALGCGNFGGIGSAPAWFGKGDDERAAIAVMDAAWELGVRRFDTADAYGGGASEAWIGHWMRATGHRPRITTKTFNPMYDGADRGLAPDRIRRQIASSLERLGVARVELYLAHEWDDATPISETVAAFEELAAAGTIGAWGVSNVDAAQLAASGRPAAVQNSYSLLDQRDAAQVLPACARAGTAYQAFGPLCGGWLAGRYRRDAPPPAGSRMTMRPEPYAHLATPRTYDALEALTARAADHGVSLAGLALAWLLAHPEVTTIVIGPRRPEHLAPVREALGLRLSAGERAAYAQLASSGT